MNRLKSVLPSVIVKFGKSILFLDDGQVCPILKDAAETLKNFTKISDISVIFPIRDSDSFTFV